MGKTTVALALLHHPQVVERYPEARLFLSCEALFDANVVVVSLAKLFGLSASGDLLTAVVGHLNAMSRVVLVLDNLETVWLTGGARDPAVEDLLGRLAQIPSLALIITCRGNDLPPSVSWNNTNSAKIEPISLRAALRTFQDSAEHQISGDEKDTAEILLNAVEGMPLAVSILGQLYRRGNSVSELLARWNREHTMMLQTHGTGRFNNVQISIEISIRMPCEADDSGEALQLLSLCCILPDGLRPAVFKQLQPKFQHIERAKDYLFTFALVKIGADKVLKTLSPIRHLVLERYPAEPKFYDELCSIYFGIAQRLPIDMSEDFKRLNALAEPEMDNLSSLLLRLVSQPSEQVVDAVHSFTRFAYWYLPNITLASSLLPHVEGHPKWKARCLQCIGHSQVKLNDYESAIESLTIATRLFEELGDYSEAAWCRWTAGQPHRLLVQYDHAERLLGEARDVYTKSGDDFSVARCRMCLGELMRMKGNYPTAIEHLAAARHTFNSLHKTFEAADCTESLGIVYLQEDELNTAAAEMEAAHTAYLSLGSLHHVAQCRRLLGDVRRRQWQFPLAEAHLGEAQVFVTSAGDEHGQAECALIFGELRQDQGRLDDAITHFKIALVFYEKLRMEKFAEFCRNQIKNLSRSHDSE